MTETPFKYHFMRYNQHGVLRPNLPFILSLLFLSRHILLLFALGGMQLKGRDGSAMEHLTPLLDKSYIISDLPAGALLFMMLARRPSAQASARWVWRHGRNLIFCSVGLYLVIVTIRNGFVFSQYAPVEWAMIALNVVVAVYAGISEYLRDLFAEFPPPPADDKPQSDEPQKTP